MSRIFILNTPIDSYTMAETLELIEAAIVERRKIEQMSVNAAKIVQMQNNMELRESVVNCDIINADGQAVVWASKILKQPLPERVAGIDVMVNLVKLAYEKKFKIFFLGAKEEVVSKVVERYSTEYSPEIVAGYRNGYFSKEEERDVAEQINLSGAQILFVAISSPKKEIFVYQNRDLLNEVYLTMGVGGSFDVVSGITKRAPLWMQRNGLEWFYRFLQEPKRMWKRYLVTNSKFIGLVLKAKFKKKSK